MFAHIDIDAFFASVLVRKDKRLKGKPLLALGMGGGCVIAASYEAKAYGVKTGMPLKEAKKLVPKDCIAMPSNFDEACAASRQIQSILIDTCPVMERMSVDEWFLDLHALIGGQPKDIQSWAEDLQQTILRKTSLTVSAGVGPSKTLAKMASEYKKPAGTTVIGSIQTFLEDRPAAAIPGIGKRRNVHAQRYGWETAWDIAQAPSDLIQQLFGRPGLELKRELNGEAVYPIVHESAPPKSVSRCRSFRVTKDRETIFAQLLIHLSYIVLKMRTQQLSCQHISVWLRDGDMEHTGRDWKLPQPLCTEDALLPYVRSCFERSFDDDIAYTQVGLCLAGLKPIGAVQYSLFDEVEKINESEDMQQALDSVHKQHGRLSVVRATTLPLAVYQKKDHGTVYGAILDTH